MKLTKISPQIFAFEFHTMKELTLTFCRAQEFYEAGDEILRGKKFDLFTFLDVMMKDSGKIKYFSTWTGFNLPSHVYDRWKELNSDYSPYEQELISVVEKERTEKKFYIIGYLKTDKMTLNHELAHALYHLNLEYRKKVDVIIDKFPIELYNVLETVLFEFGYGDNVIDDEMNAYLSTSGRRYLRKSFKVNKKYDKYIKNLETLFICYYNNLREKQCFAPQISEKNSDDS